MKPLTCEGSKMGEDKQKEETYGLLKKYSVVVVDNTGDLRNYLKEFLEGYFNQIYVSKDGKDALRLIKERLPDLIVTDVMTPRMNGFELCRKVKNDADISHIPVILLTAYDDMQNMHVGYKMGADAFLSKPFEMDTLLAVMGNLLKLREQIRARYNAYKVVSLEDKNVSNADESFLLRLNTLIAENMDNSSLNVTFLSINMGISRSLLFNKVKNITGMGIVGYVNKMRIEKSVHLLTTTSLSITEISERVGFSSLHYFSEVFKSIKGESPSAYRK